MDTIFHILFLHMRSFWRRARGLFVSTCFQGRLQPSAPTPHTHTQRPPTPIPSRIPPKISMARTKVWACRRARKLRAQMKERRIAKKQAMYARIAALAIRKEGKGGASGEDEEEEDEEEVPEGSDAPKAPLEPRTRRPLSPLQLPHWDVSALGLELQLDLGLDFPSPTESYTSASTTTGPRTPVTPITPTTASIPPGSFHFPRIKAGVATESPAHLRRDPRAARGGRFRTLSASLTARSPLSLSFPLSFSLSLSARRASSPSVPLQRYVYGGEGEEDPFGTHGSGYYAALSLGDAYDLSAWAWACEFSPQRRVKKRVRAATTGSASASVYSAPVHAASAPQLTYAQHGDVELEYSRMLANAGTGVTGGRDVVQAPVTTNTNARESNYAAVPRRGMRPLLLPQKLGLLTIGATSGGDHKTEDEAERTRTDSWASVRRESGVRGWDVDLERGVWAGDKGCRGARC